MSEKTQQKCTTGRRYKISVVSSCTNPNAEVTPPLPWTGIVRLCTEKGLVRSKDGRAIIPSVLEPPRRKKANATMASLLIYDIEDHQIGDDLEDVVRWVQDRLPGVRSLLYTSWNHGVEGKWSPGAPRLRLVIPLSRDVDSQSEYADLWQWGYEQLDKAPDPACKDSARLYFLLREANPNSEIEPWFEVLNGEDLDPDQLPDGQTLSEFSQEPEDVVLDSLGSNTPKIVDREASRTQATSVLTYVVDNIGGLTPQEQVKLAFNPFVLLAASVAHREGDRVTYVQAENAIKKTDVPINTWRQAVEEEEPLLPSSVSRTDKSGPPTQPINVTEELALVVEALEYIVDRETDDGRRYVDDRDLWLRVGMALHHNSRGSEDALLVWDRWSRASSKYEYDACSRAWESFSKGETNAVTVGTIIKWAKNHGWSTPHHTSDILPDATHKSLSLRLERELSYKMARSIKVNGVHRPVTWNPNGDWSIGLVRDLGSLWRYNGEERRWVEIDGKDIARHLQRTTYRYAKGTKKDAEGKVVEVITEPVPINSYTARGAWDLLQALPEGDFGKGFFENAPVSVQTRNALLTLHQGNVHEVVGHHPLWRQRHMLDCEYQTDATPNRWLQYLDEIFDGDADAEEKIALLQEFVGAAVFGIAHQWQKALILIGQGGDGKSVFLDVCRGLFPADAVAAVAPHKMGDEFTLTNLVGARMNIVSDIEKRALLTPAMIKQLISADVVEINRKGRDPIVYRPRCAHAFSCNGLPPTADDSRGFWRRWLVVEFTNRMDLRDDCDPELASKILNSEKAGLLSWAIEGANRLLSAGEYTAPPSSARRLMQWRVGSNPVAQWAIEHVVETDETGCFNGEQSPGRSRKQAVYDSYSLWCKRYNYRHKSRASFNSAMESLGYEVRRNGKNGQERWQFTLSTAPITSQIVAYDAEGHTGFSPTVVELFAAPPKDKLDTDAKDEGEADSLKDLKKPEEESGRRPDAVDIILIDPEMVMYEGATLGVMADGAVIQRMTIDEWRVLGYVSLDALDWGKSAAAPPDTISDWCRRGLRSDPYPEDGVESA